MVRRVRKDLEDLNFNTMVAVLVEYANYLSKIRGTTVVNALVRTVALETLVLLLAPGIPNISESL